MSNRIPYQTILDAKSGDTEAMEKILSHYAPYIQHWAKGSDWVYQEAQSKLVYAVMKFNIERNPPNLTAHSNVGKIFI